MYTSVSLQEGFEVARMSPQSLQKSWQEITVETQEGVSWHSSPRGSLEIPASPAHFPLGFWESGRKVLHLDSWGPRGQTLAQEDKTSHNALVSGLLSGGLEVGFEWIPHFYEMCSVRGQSYIFQSYCIMLVLNQLLQSGTLSYSAGRYFILLIWKSQPMSCSRPVRSESGALKGTKGKRFR